MGRKLKEIDPAEVEQMAKWGASMGEIASALGVGKTTLHRRFGTVYMQARASTKISLRRAQVERALGGSDSMLIHLGRHLLGQRERIQVDGLLTDALNHLEKYVDGDGSDDEGQAEGDTPGPAEAEPERSDPVQ